jgi:RNA polymerase sigma-70 factor, ECF subfamily
VLRLTVAKPRELDDAAAVRLLVRIGQGDERAFDELWDAIKRRVLLFAMSRLGDRQDAEEVSNDTGWELWRHPDRFRGDSRFMTYVLGIANNKAKSLLRSRGHREEDPGDDVEEAPDPDPTPFEALLSKEKLAAVTRCMERLSKRQRSVVHLAYFEDMSREEIGRIIGCQGNAVRQHLCQALRKLKPCLAASDLK